VEIVDIPGRNASAAGDGRSRVVYLGQLSERERIDVIVRMTGPARKDGAVVEVLDGVLAFEDAAFGAGQLTRDVYLGADATADKQAIAKARNLDVLRDAARQVAAAAKVQAIALARDGQLPEAKKLLD